ncbi:leukemia inhibitory factor receptor isoform X1 [Labrus bergylta]|uniref:leukemia inhibitory factor receptor isoform X1 n=2 Tax=Labrus bergylta TaxID=56723 RepID=UPI003313EF4B
MRRTIMISWLLLFVSLFYQSTQDGIGKEKGVLHCGPQNMTLEKFDQMILSTWQDDPSCFALRDVLIYELVVLIEDQEVHHDKLAVLHNQIGSTHSWSWTPYLALECASHSVRISLRYNNRTSPWTQEKTLPGRGASKKPQVFPRDKVFEVGRHGNFCCIMPAGAVFNKMYMSGYNNSNMKTRKINNQTYVLTVLLDQPSNNSCTNVICQTSDYGACAYIGYRPDDRDLQCETQDLESVDCLWTVGKELPKRQLSTEYQLNGSDCPNGSKGRCSQRIQEVGERTWTLTAKNNLGKRELTDRADLMKRVHMFAPEGVSASAVNARNVTLSWRWKVLRYSNLNITCQVNVSHFETNTMSEIFGVGLLSVVVTDLIPNWTYNVAVRCGTTEHFWKWSNWSASVNFHTRGDVPDALDVWMQARDNQTVIIWKEPQSNESHGDILEYEVSWTETAERERLNKTKVDHNFLSVSLTLDPTEEHIVTVSARNINGSSSPTTIVIPRRKSVFLPDITNVETDGIIGSDGGFNLSWSVSSAASCGYVVDWCPASENCRVEWLKVPPNVTNTRVFSKSFKAGVRYSLSVYACTNRAPVFLERREGYTEEKRIEDSLFQSLKWNQRDSDVEISWEPVPLRNQPAFIYGYVLYVDNNNNKVLSVSTDDPKASSLTATNLNINTYTFTVKAKTAAGEEGTTTITATLNSLTDNLIEIVCVSLVAVFGLLSLVTILCFRHWSCIKHKVYPPIPTPVLRDKWLTTGENRCHHLRVDQFPHSEADVMDVPELHKPGAPVNDYVIQNVSAHTQTEKGYYNQPVRNCIPQPSSAIHPPLRSLFPNPLYSLTMVPGYQWCSSGPEPQGGTHLERSSDGYQPHSEAERSSVNQTEVRPDSPISCVSTYILLPQSPQ